MGLFDRFRQVAARVSVPAAVTVSQAADTLCAPCDGRLIAMADVPDPVFSGEVMGKGCAIWPGEDVVYAPISGSVSVTMSHAAGIVGEDGIEALVHVGVDTVGMGGASFTGYVREGDAITAGHPILSMDRAEIAAAGHPDCVVLVVTNTDEFAAVELLVEPGSTVSAGQAVLRVVR